jgi:hypothetical protein
MGRWRGGGREGGAEFMGFLVELGGEGKVLAFVVDDA